MPGYSQFSFFFSYFHSNYCDMYQYRYRYPSDVFYTPVSGHYPSGLIYLGSPFALSIDPEPVDLPVQYTAPPGGLVFYIIIFLPLLHIHPVRRAGIGPEAHLLGSDFQAQVVAVILAQRQELFGLQLHHDIGLPRQL